MTLLILLIISQKKKFKLNNCYEKSENDNFFIQQSEIIYNLFSKLKQCLKQILSHLNSRHSALIIMLIPTEVIFNKKL